MMDKRFLSWVARWIESAFPLNTDERANFLSLLKADDPSLLQAFAIDLQRWTLDAASELDVVLRFDDIQSPPHEIVVYLKGHFSGELSKIP